MGISRYSLEPQIYYNNIHYYIAGAYETKPIRKTLWKKFISELNAVKKKHFGKRYEEKPVSVNAVKKKIVHRNAVKKKSISINAVRKTLFLSIIKFPVRLYDL